MGNLSQKEDVYFLTRRACRAIFFSFRVRQVTKKRIKMEDNILEFFISPLENELLKQICENLHFELGMPPEPNIQKTH